jgi:hypothetical protein
MPRPLNIKLTDVLADKSNGLTISELSVKYKCCAGNIYRILREYKELHSVVEESTTPPIPVVEEPVTPPTPQTPPPPVAEIVEIPSSTKHFIYTFNPDMLYSRYNTCLTISFNHRVEWTPLDKRRIVGLLYNYYNRNDRFAAVVDSYRKRINVIKGFHEETGHNPHFNIILGNITNNNTEETCSGTIHAIIDGKCPTIYQCTYITVI